MCRMCQGEYADIQRVFSHTAQSDWRRVSTDAFWKLLGLLNPDAVHALCKIPDVSYISPGRFQENMVWEGQVENIGSPTESCTKAREFKRHGIWESQVMESWSVRFICRLVHVRILKQSSWQRDESDLKLAFAPAVTFGHTFGPALARWTD